MHISWLGYSAFRITTGGTTIIVDPVDAVSGFKVHKQGADIVLSSADNQKLTDAVSGAPFMITGPGEYEVKTVFVYGAQHNASTIYSVVAEDVSVAVIGPIKVKEIANSQLELIEGNDILIIPVGGGPVCAPKEAVQIINQIEPRIVIPSYYRIKGSKGLGTVEAFLKEYAAPHKELDKLKVSKKEVQSEETRVVILRGT